MSEALSGAGTAHIVCVATGYGELVMQKDAFADIRQGRLTEAEMEALIREEASIVFDATHPYASVVSENIRGACRAAGADYVRIVRSGGGAGAPGCSVRAFEDAAACAAALLNTEGNILLTTGSKDLCLYAAEPGLRGRLFVRVLPSEESIRLCGEAGIRGRQVIAMQGPFSREMDLAVINQFDISVLVTKESGRAGGFGEKLEAAAEAGIPVFLIGRPSGESGISAEAALLRYFRIRPEIRIDLVGIGPGRASLMTAEARDAVRNAEVLFGAARMIGPYAADREAFPYYLAKDIIPVIESRRPGRVAVLFSGDTGFFSGAANMKAELEEWLADKDFDCRLNVHPGISSFAYLAAKAGIAYHDAALCSMHGRSGDEENEKRILSSLKSTGKAFVLMSGPEDVFRLGELLEREGAAGCSVVIGKDLSYPDETIIECSPSACRAVREPGLYTALVLAEKNH